MHSESPVDPSGFRNVVDPVVAAGYREAGWWGEVTIADVVGRWAGERPSADAFVTVEHRFSWAQYDAASRRLAGVLVAAGLEAGERVGVLLPDGASVHVAFVAAERAGLTVVGLGARAGDRELLYLLRKTKAAALVTLAEHRGRPVGELVASLRAGGVRLRRHVVVPCFEAEPAGAILVDGIAVAPSAGVEVVLAGRRLGPDDVFMVNSTSGTTGLPKCVVHTQNRWMYFHGKAVEHGTLGDEVVLAALPAPFGFGLWTAHFTPALLGAPTVVMDHFDPATALALIERERVTMVCCVSTQFILLLNSPAMDGHDLSSLRLMFTGGEAVPYERAVAFEARTGATVLQFFGSNETGLLSGTRLADPPERRLRTAGRTVAEMQVRLYRDGVDVTATGVGQPAGKGPATCVGYLDDPAANAELFTPDGWVLMGDICTLDDEGWLAVVGRKSDIIIRGGKNISAVQVEEEVGSHPAVILAAAVAMVDPVFGERVCVYVELAGGQLSIDELAAYLTDRGTSKELFPERLIVLDELPRSSGGKVAKAQLRADLERRLARERGSEPP